MSSPPDTPPSPPPRARFVPTRELLWWAVVAGLLAAVGLMKAINLLLLLSYLLAALLVVNAVIAWRTVRRVAVVRREHGPAFAGEPVTHVAEVTNTAEGGAITVTVREVRPTDARSWFVPGLPAGRTALTSVERVYFKRGRHAVPAIEAVSGYPFGLALFTRPLTDPSGIRVLPPIGTIDVTQMRRWMIRSGTGDARTSRPSARHAPADGDLRGVRPYRVGDSPRDIHWKSTARRGKLLVREYDALAPLDLVLIVEPWVPAVPTDRRAAAKLEWVLSLATSMAWAWVNSDLGGRLTLVVAGETPTEVSGTGTPAFVRSGFARLAEVVGTPMVSLVLPAAARKNRHAARVVVSTRGNSPLLATVRAGVGPSAGLDPSAPPVWFAPPEVVKSG